LFIKYNAIMHELAITESILNIASTHAAKAEAVKVTDIYLVIGRLSSIVDDSIQFYWDMISENTICSGAKLHFKRIPAKMVCLDCATPFTLDGDLTPCPACQSSRVKVTAGEEFYLDSIEITQ
jgi:hydrogenase nickel incorporation protein HypA/HybF